MILKDIKEFTAQWKACMKDYIERMEKKPGLAIIQVGDVEASNRYVRNKIKDCEEVGIKTQLFKFPEDISDVALISQLNMIEENDDFTGVFIQLPLPQHLQGIEKLIDPAKDVDGFTPDSGYTPCTPLGIVKYLDYCGFNLDGKNVLVIGRSDIVGKPMARLLLDRNATVTVAHSHTKNLDAFIYTADLIVCAVGKANFLSCETIYVPVIDVGINFDENGKLVGDCYKTENRDVTPVPGGVGLLTRCALLHNLVTGIS